MRRRGFSGRAWCVALMCSVLLVTASATTAGATATTTHVATVNGRVGPVHDDPTCPPNVDFPGGVEQSQKIVGLLRTRIGPAAVVADVCYIFVGAIGGERLHGSFSVLTFAGTLRGTADGTIGFGASDHYALTLTVEHGSWLLSHVRGTFALDGDVGRDSPAFTGTLTSDLHVQWGSHQLPLPLI
jgi:hypothetical protein